MEKQLMPRHHIDELRLEKLLIDSTTIIGINAVPANTNSLKVIFLGGLHAVFTFMNNV